MGSDKFPTTDTMNTTNTMDNIHQLRSADELEKKADIEMHEMSLDGKGVAYMSTSHGTALTGFQTMRKYWKVSCLYSLLRNALLKQR
jgi:hypothetical protein